MPDLVLAHYPNLQYFPVETAESLRNPNGGMVSKDVIRKAMLQLHLPRAHAHAPEDRLAWVTVSYVEVNSKGVSLVKSNVINTKLDMEHGDGSTLTSAKQSGRGFRGDLTPTTACLSKLRLAQGELSTLVSNTREVT